MKKALELVEAHFLQKNWTPLKDECLPRNTIAFSKNEGKLGIYIRFPGNYDTTKKTTINCYLALYDWTLHYHIGEKIVPQAPEAVNRIIQSADEAIENLNALARAPFNEIFARITPGRLLAENLLEKISPLHPDKHLFLGYNKTQKGKEPLWAFLHIRYYNKEGYQVSWKISRNNAECYLIWPCNQSVVAVRKARTYNQFESFIEQGNIIGVEANLPDCLLLLENVSPELASYCEEATKAFSECWEVSW